MDDKRDAERYRFLRQQALKPELGLEPFVAINQLDFCGRPELFDAVIDEIIAGNMRTYKGDDNG